MTYNRRVAAGYICSAVLLIACRSASGSDYAGQYADAVSNCGTINPKDYQTGLVFNPDGYRSLYTRSACFQKMAIKFRDSTLCDEVRQRRSLFLSSWGYSKSNCEKLVSAGIQSDLDAINALRIEYEKGHRVLEDFRIERNGNGRDFDIIPQIAGEGAHNYRLDFILIPKQTRTAPVLLHSSGFYLNGKNDIRIYVRQADIHKQYPSFELNQTYDVRALLVLAIGNGSQGGLWSDAFIDEHFPERKRTQLLTREIHL